MKYASQSDKTVENSSILTKYYHRRGKTAVTERIQSAAQLKGSESAGLGYSPPSDSDDATSFKKRGDISHTTNRIDRDMERRRQRGGQGKKKETDSEKQMEMQYSGRGGVVQRVTQRGQQKQVQMIQFSHSTEGNQ
ncbi:hypothetical protein SRHO_G00205270 [Serrasalmus rhombeus]